MDMSSISAVLSSLSPLSASLLNTNINDNRQLVKNSFHKGELKWV
jgi:hypothetical protein